MPEMIPDNPHPALQREMDLATFRDLGYLQEVNRQFLHPLGLALAFEHVEDGSVPAVKVWDEREDPEGFMFFGFTDSEIERGKVIEDTMRARLAHRLDELGYGIQPLENAPEIGRD
jgi:hypothetical protein